MLRSSSAITNDDGSSRHRGRSPDEAVSASEFVRATLPDNPSMTADEIRRIVTCGERQTLEFKETTAQMPRAVKTLAASVIMNRA